MSLPRCLVVPPWAEPPIEHAVIALTPVETPPRSRLDTRAAQSVLNGAESSVSTFREYAKVPMLTRNRSSEMDAFCKGRLDKGQTWNLEGLIHTMSDEAAFAVIVATNAAIGAKYLCARYGDRGAVLAMPTLPDDARELAEDVSFIEASSLARTCIRDFGKVPRRADALAYLVRYVETAALTTIPIALAKGKARANARQLLRAIAREHAVAVIAAADRYGADARRAVDVILATSEPLTAPKLPAFADAEQLPAPLLRASGERLSLDQTRTVLQLLALSTLDAPIAELDALRGTCDERSLAELAWSLTRAWLDAGAPAKEDWAFHALGLFGDDASARKIAPLVRAWPGEGFHARAVVGVDVLAAIGTDVALMHLHAMAQKVKFKALQEQARAKMSEVARARGLDDESLADRLVPLAGLDADDALTLDFGPRAFRVTFDEALSPRVALASDPKTTLADLPKMKQGDDEPKARAAIERWKALRQDLSTISHAQVARLELAMSNARRWNAQDFRRFIIEHPLMIHLARRLVWRDVDHDVCFRVDESRRFTDAADADFTLADDTHVSLLHPIDVSPDVLATFARLFADYEILQPFEQLGRSVHRLTAEEAEKRTLERFSGRTCKVQALLRLGGPWRRDDPEDGGTIMAMIKRLGAADASLLLQDGFSVVTPLETPEQTLGVITVRGAANFGALAPSQTSDLLRDVEHLLVN